MADIALLRKFFIRVIHQIPAIAKSIAIWALGLLHLICLHEFPSCTVRTQMWRRRLATLGVTPFNYTFAFFETAAVVYIKMAFQEPTTKSPWIAQAWNTLFCLTSPGRLSFDTGRRLRTGEFHDWEIYALYRLANHLEQPKRGQARKLLASAMQFRNLTVPKGNKPVSIQFLAHDSFSKAVEKFLREHVIQFKELAVPLHLPTAKIREAASPKLSAVLQNFKAFDHLDHGHDGSHLSCCCPQLLDKVSPHIRRDVQRQFGLHVAVSLEDLILPPELRLLQYANANSTFFLTKKDFFTRFHAQVRSWSKYHGLPPIGDDFIEEFLETHWVLHTAQLQYAPRYTKQLVVRLKAWLPRSCVIHHADHEAYKFTLFCPCLYFQGTYRTWSDKDLFEPFSGTVQDAMSEVSSALSSRLQSKYRWGIRKDAKLPTGFVFLKRKKQFLKGRTLISYFRSYYAVLMQVTARTIDSMCVQLWPQTFGQLSVPNIWRAIDEHFTVASEEITFDVINDDLIGFFNSIPQHRLLDAVHSLVAAWKQHHGDTVLSVDVSLKGPAMYTTYVGQFRKAHSPGRSVLPDNIFEIVAASLKSNIFLALNQVWKQFRGAGIGAHISPSLSNLAVTIVERTCAYTFRDAINSPSLAFMGLRYVDNRFVLFQAFGPQPPAIAVLAHSEFYELPVELEPVDSQEFLGFFVDHRNRTVQFKFPELSQIRDVYSAGSLRLRLSGLRSRAHSITRYTFPCTDVLRSIEQLLALYQRKGFSYKDCKRALQKSCCHCSQGGARLDSIFQFQPAP